MFACLVQAKTIVTQTKNTTPLKCNFILWPDLLCLSPWLGRDTFLTILNLSPTHKWPEERTQIHNQINKYFFISNYDDTPKCSPARNRDVSV